MNPETNNNFGVIHQRSPAGWKISGYRCLSCNRQFRWLSKTKDHAKYCIPKEIDYAPQVRKLKENNK